MPLTLHVDAQRWRLHTAGFLSRNPGVVPVIKGNGYGFGRHLLASEVSRVGLPALAAGTYDEVSGLRPDAAEADAEILVLTPWRPFLDVSLEPAWLVHTVSRLSDLRALSGSGVRAVIEVRTSMRRHGLLPAEIPQAAGLLTGIRFEGWSMHLPLAGDALGEATELAARTSLTAAEPGHRLWVSHLGAGEVDTLAQAAGSPVRLRSGTAMWLGDRGALAMRGTVLDSHPVLKGARAGYRLVKAPSDGTLLIIAGGTAHGVGLQAPTQVAGLRQSGAALVRGALAASGRSLSPFRVGGKRRWFYEPPHMQVSMVWLPDGVDVPEVGSDVELDVRFTTTTADRVVLE